jgi:uncharacterized coiled-coil DUF342 family protein
MAVMAREAWTDERLDDLNKKVDEGFTEIRTEFRAVRRELRVEMGEVRSEIAALNNTIHQFMFAMVGTVFLGFCGTIAALISLT